MLSTIPFPHSSSHNADMDCSLGNSTTINNRTEIRLLQQSPSATRLVATPARQEEAVATSPASSSLSAPSHHGRQQCELNLSISSVSPSAATADNAAIGAPSLCLDQTTSLPEQHKGAANNNVSATTESVDSGPYPEEEPTKEQTAAAIKIQAAIRGYNTRKDLFAGPILTSLQKWRYLALYSRLNTRSTPISPTSSHSQDNVQDSQDSQQHEQQNEHSQQGWKARLWTRMILLTSNLCKDSGALPSEEALVLLTEHWLEMSDKKHRYGSNLKPYHEYWLRETTSEDFFDWLDNGGGKDLSLEERPRTRLEEELVQYLQEHEREQYAVKVENGLLYYRESGKPVHTLPDSVQAGDEVDISQILPDADDNDDEATRLEKKRLRNRAKYIYVLGPKGVLYIARKIKGRFHHSSFFCGGTVCAAGGIIVNHGRLVKVTPKSGHYRPGQKHFDRLLHTLRERGVSLDNVKISTSIFDPAADG